MKNPILILGALVVGLYVLKGPQWFGNLFGISGTPPPPAGPVSPPASGQGSLSNQGGPAGNTPVVYAQAAQGFANAIDTASSALVSIFDAMRGSSTKAPDDPVTSPYQALNAGAGGGAAWIGYTGTLQGAPSFA